MLRASYSIKGRKKRKNKKKKPEVTGDSCGGRAVFVYLRDSTGSIYSHRGGRGTI